MKAYKLVIFALEGTILTENHSFYAGVRDLLKKYSFENKYILIQKFHDTPFSLTFSRDIFYKRRKDKYGKAKILTRDEYGYDIPDSDPIDTILKKYELSDKSVIYIGSTEEDYEAACSAGVDYAMALWAFPESQHSELREKYTCCQLDDVYLYVNPDDCENKEKIQSRVSAIKNVISYDRRNVVDNIRYLMDAHYISQNAMAKYLNKDQSSINRMLSGKHDISFETLMLFASVLNVPVEHLLDMPPKRRDHFPCDGFVEYNGKIHRIKSISDLKKLADELHYITKELPNIVKGYIEKSKKIKREDKDEIDTLNIDLFREEIYDPNEYYIWTFRKADDIKYGIENPLGNMCQGFPFSVGGVEFYGSEQAYIAGLFSENSDKHISIQKALIAESNGYQSKKSIRNKNIRFGRRDWEEFNVQWMLYVVWQKCKQNSDFAKLLKKTKKGSIIIENSSMQNGETATFWGCVNEEWKSACAAIDKNANAQLSGRKKSEIDEKIMNDINSIDYIGTYKGVNCMGKILTICRDSLLYGEEPSIDYELLRSKHIHILGQELKFEK